jgi:predicted site-specific integrase-resolvase
LYSKEDVGRVFCQAKTQSEIKNRTTVLYARVSSPHQVEDLNRQVEYLQTFCKEKYQSAELIKDIGSGLNWKRKGLETLLERIHEGDIEQVVVTYKDRLCRFGYELFEWICQKHDTKIVVLNKVSETSETETDRTKELAEDLFSIVTVFVAKNNGMRSSKNRQLRKEIGGGEEDEGEKGISETAPQQKTERSVGSKNKKDKDASKRVAGGET